MSSPKKDRKIQSDSGTNVQGGDGGRLGAARFAEAMSVALRKEFGDSAAAIKTVVRLTGANPRAVKNWFEKRNGPSGQFLIVLCGSSDQVLETVLLLAGRSALVPALRVAEAKEEMRRLLKVLEEYSGE